MQLQKRRLKKVKQIEIITFETEVFLAGMRGQLHEDVEKYRWAIAQMVRRLCCGRSASNVLKFSAGLPCM
jgi:hypothetical protein